MFRRHQPSCVSFIVIVPAARGGWGVAMATVVRYLPSSWIGMDNLNLEA